MTDNKPSAIQRGVSVIGKLFVGSRKGPTGERARGLRKLQKRIEVRFTDVTLLEQAITHRSYSHVTSQTRNDSNERMEFLGDSVLGLAVSQFLYLKFPDHSEGALSKMKSLLVSRKVLSSIAREIGLGEFLLLSGEEAEMGGRDRASILADSFEGVIGAIYLDQGYRAANKFIQHFLLANIQDILKDEDHTNFKSLLQEYVQSKRLSHPVYRVRKEEGPEHEKEFAIEVVVKGEVWGVGRGKSKKDAEQNAARAALEKRQGRTGTKRAVSGAERAPAAAEAEERGSGGRSRRRRGGERAEPAVKAKDRGDHGIAASRDKLRATRKERAEDKRRVEKERRDQVREAAEADRKERAASSPDVAGAGVAAGGGEETAPSEERSRGRAERRGGERSRSEPSGEAEITEDVTSAEGAEAEGEERDRPRRRRRRRRGGSREGAAAGTSSSDAESARRHEDVESGDETAAEVIRTGETPAEVPPAEPVEPAVAVKAAEPEPEPAEVRSADESSEVADAATGFVRRKKRRQNRPSSGATGAKSDAKEKEEDASSEPGAEAPRTEGPPAEDPEPVTAPISGREGDDEAAAESPPSRSKQFVSRKRRRA